MKLIFRFMKPYAKTIALAVFLKFIGTVMELTLPYILEHIIDVKVPEGNIREVILWGGLMFLGAALTWVGNATANHEAVKNAHNVSYDARQALFEKTMNLSGKQFDSFGLPSIISRMTSDSYNLQTAAVQLQALCVRAPMMLIGGLIMMLTMDVHLSLILVCMLPFLFAIILLISSKGIPLYKKVQERLDDVVRIMREDITGIRVVKALSKTEYEKRRFKKANEDMTESDIYAGTTMAVPGPLMQLLLNFGLAAVVYIGARRVNAGLTEPGVILAFLTYFNMITMGVMGLNRIFISLSKASASANRMAEVIDTPIDEDILPPSEGKTPAGPEFIRFEHVTFSYVAESEQNTENFAGEERQNALSDIDFSIKKGESLGIIGPTGCGKTTIINLLMHFYDATEGGVFVDGRDVRTYPKDELHKKFGTVFQNDMVFQDTLYENINFGRDLPDADVKSAVADAQAAEYVSGLSDGLSHMASIKGANLSGGQKQRLLVARALAGNPEILVLDDSSSALDYKTDASMRKAIAENHKDTTLIMIAQRVSSIMNLSHILVLDNGACIGYGTHEELLASCPEYKEIYDAQMGALN